MRLLLIVLMSLGLAACFTGEKPLIAAHEAEFPIATPTEITAQIRGSGPKNFRLERRGGSYALIDPNSKKGDKIVETVLHYFIMRSIGNDMFIAQKYVNAKAECRPCYYGLIRLVGKRIAVHEFEHFGERVLLTDEELARFVLTAKNKVDYEVSSFENTAALFRYLLERPRPDRVYMLR